MEKKINIAELLKNCPNGMELDCTIYNGNVCFEAITNHAVYPIQISINSVIIECLDIWGRCSTKDYAKCVIFPKGKTTWEGFIPPYKFKDGDVVATNTGSWIGITTGGEAGKFMPTYCVIKFNGEFEAYFDYKEKWEFNRFATEEEKEGLFQAIKENGYKWNAETKILEELIKPKFKVGDKIVNNGYLFEIIEVDIEGEVYGYKSKVGGIGGFLFAEQDQWELAPNKFDITTLKPFDKVLVRDNDEQLWTADLFGSYHGKTIYPFRCVGHYTNQCVPYKGNELLLGTNDNCNEFYKTWE